MPTHNQYATLVSIVICIPVIG